MKQVFAVLLALASFAACGHQTPPNLTEQLESAGPPPFTLTSWESDFISNGTFPPAPSPEYIAAPDSLDLAYRDWEPVGWDGTGDIVLFVPGSTSHSGHYTVIGNSLSGHGIFCRIVDVRGMGLSVRQSAASSVNDFTPRIYTDDSVYYTGRIGDSLDANQIVRDISLHIVSLRDEFPDARIFLGGHSSGGGIVSRYVEANGDYLVSGIILCAPFNHVDQPQNIDEANSRYSFVDLGALGDALRGNIHRYVIGFNLGEMPGLELSVVQYSYTTLTGSSTTGPAAFLKAFSKPVLWIHGDSDQLFDRDLSHVEFLKIIDLSGLNSFKVIDDTSHIGLSWSSETGEAISTWLGTI